MTIEYNYKIKIIVEKLSKCKEIIGISLVGSSLNNSNPNDIDFLVISTNNVKTKKYIKNEFKDYNCYQNDDSIRIKNYIDLEIGMGIYNIKNINNKIENYILGKNVDPVYKNWNIVGWLPESLLYDLNKMIILYEKNDCMNEIKNRVKIYPEKLKKAIIDNCEIKINNLNTRIKKASGIELKIIKSEILALEIRKKFAIKEKYFNGYKNIDEKLRESEIYLDEK